MAGTDITAGADVPDAVRDHAFAVVLVDPQMGENIGATARAMLNFGLTDLRIVNPRDGWPNVAASANASRAFDDGVIPTVYDTLDDALADRTFILATCPRLRDMTKDMLRPKAAAHELHRVVARGDRAALMFGPERAGLNNDQVALAHAQVAFPTNPKFSSLNLAQAVLLMAYEFYAHADDVPQAYLRDSGVPAATRESVGYLEQHLADELEEAEFFRSPGHKPVMLRNLRTLVARSRLTEQEVHTLRGVIKSLARGRFRREKNKT